MSRLFRAIALKLASALMFALLSAFVRYCGETGVPVGQIVFFRSACAIVPVLIIYAWRNELIWAVRTSRPFGHLGRGTISVIGMFLNFEALARLPLVDATPLITVAFAAWFLGERVRAYRWTAVGVGFAGVIVMMWPYLNFSQYGAAGAAALAASVGAMLALAGAFTNAGAVI
jgi:drug/metabolite transporter (DMT)-like permease